MHRHRPVFLPMVLATLAGAAAPLALAAAPGGAEAKPDQPAQAPPPPAAATPGASEEQTLTPDQLYELGKTLFDEYASPEIKQQYEFPSKEQWDEFAVKLQRALEGDSLEELAAYEPQARTALAALRTLPGYEDYADWLEERLDLIETARLAARPQPPPPTAPIPSLPSQRRFAMPYYDLWLQRLRGRPMPPNAADLVPRLRAAFAAEGVPADLVWMAEVESTFNPNARSPAGAKGLFQLMPETAKALGLSTWLPDERTDPEKSAHAAARLLRSLHARFGDWPLALAAYNAGAGRVSRTLTAKRAKTFSEIAQSLPAETRLYVPKIYATITLRTGLPPEQLAGLEVRRSAQEVPVGVVVVKREIRHQQPAGVGNGTDELAEQREDFAVDAVSHPEDLVPGQRRREFRQVRPLTGYRGFSPKGRIVCEEIGADLGPDALPRALGEPEAEAGHDQVTVPWNREPGGNRRALGFPKSPPAGVVGQAIGETSPAAAQLILHGVRASLGVPGSSLRALRVVAANGHEDGQLLFAGGGIQGIPLHG
jgi:membrane-bound lytic murein transglycosylase D